MPSIVTRKYRVKNAKEFIESLSDAEGDKFYLFIGRSVPWPASGDLSSTAVPTPADTVKDSTFDVWRDMMALVRLTPNNVIQVVPRKNWSNNTIYNMYDHRANSSQLYANTTTPFYVLNNDREVFKCIFNGKYPGGVSFSLAEPSTTGLEDITKLVTTNADPYDYLWKYMYKIDGEYETKYLTPEYMPVKSVATVLDTLNTSPNFGDIYDDSSDQYTLFQDARTSNGAILSIVVESGGSGYTQGAQVAITGDGNGAEAIAVVEAGQVKQVNMILRGTNYSYANVAIVDAVGGGTGAVVNAIISPRNSFTNTSGTYYVTNHGIDLEQELSASTVMIYATLNQSGLSGNLPTEISYRRVGIVRNPLLYNSNTIASGLEYTQTWNLELTGSTVAGLFSKNEIVWQNKGVNGIAYGVVAESQAALLKLTHVYGTFEPGLPISGIGNGNTGGYIVGGGTSISSIPEPFTPQVPASGNEATVNAVYPPDLAVFSGEILLVDHKSPVYRDDIQIETIRFVLSF